ncbi:BPL-N domain-containing protein [Dactylosporangium roseum]|uniref:BPL-N domain-containing protein n=1 Tax=Dactylosporangium roseum TaxID=47989 RepID=UPI0021B3A624|nr:BPL-N domain-containing protein [Dactylosporangium roseum]
MNRRAVLLGAGGVGLLATVTGVAVAASVVLSKARPLALVYRGQAACSGCSEAVAVLLRGAPARFDTQFCGPDEDVQISAATLAEAAVYAQPGGGDVRQAWRRVRTYADDIRRFVDDGGNYLGFCLGAYLAGARPGYGLLNGIGVNGYIYSKGATIHGTDDTVVAVRWRGQPRHMYFQDGAAFTVKPGTTATVLATYDTGAAAALVTSYGAGHVGVVGPHPEADSSWYSDTRLSNPDGIRFDLGHDLIQTTFAR